ncbi:palmdelphin-like [Corythoichthys intestinalis]|uniref:palmdelphin-like n=1 Tax=Corythoichthys intestinalis TaxID=161448 RepID=UPI0025A5C3BC|nr:palmdelphin-like [Corythoichthys intestinalis]XP_061805175.1 palmdelphin-like [Nerophis lumbriciformis]
MAQRMFQESGKDGRSVLGMLTVQVERDPKTGAAVVKSVAPMTTPVSEPLATTVFDDGRRSIHAVCESGFHPSTEELGQILSFVDDVGMQVMLDEVTVTANETEPKLDNAEANGVPVKKTQASVNRSMSKENHLSVNRHISPNSEANLMTEVSASMRSEKDANVMVLRDTSGKEVTMEDQDLEESPVTLLFLGYTDSTTTQEDPNMLTAERVIISDDGEENSVADQGAGKENPSDMYRNISPKENVQTSQVLEDRANKKSSAPAAEDGKSPSKRKTCQCCSVM